MLAFICIISYGRTLTVISWILLMKKFLMRIPCWQFFAIHLDIPEGVHGGKLGAHVAGRPSSSEANS